MATPAFITATSAFTGNSATSVAVSKPAGMLVDDFMVAAVDVHNVAANIGAPSGWTLIRTDRGPYSEMRIFTKRVASSEPSSYTFTSDTANAISGVIAAYRDVLSVDVHGGNNSGTTADTTAIAPSISTAPDCRVVCVHGVGASISISTPSGTTRREGVESTGFNSSIQLVDYENPSGGNTGTKSATLGSAMYWAAAQLALSYDPPNTAPNAPILTDPASGQTVDRTATNRFAWTFSDPDAGDTQSAYDLEVREQGETALLVNATATTANNYRDITGGTLPPGPLEWRVRTYDAAAVVGPWSAWVAFSATPGAAYVGGARVLRAYIGATEVKELA